MKSISGLIFYNGGSLYYIAKFKDLESGIYDLDYTIDYVTGHVRGRNIFTHDLSDDKVLSKYNLNEDLRMAVLSKYVYSGFKCEIPSKKSVEFFYKNCKSELYFFNRIRVMIVSFGRRDHISLFFLKNGSRSIDIYNGKDRAYTETELNKKIYNNLTKLERFVFKIYKKWIL